LTSVEFARQPRGLNTTQHNDNTQRNATTNNATTHNTATHNTAHHSTTHTHTHRITQHNGTTHTHTHPHTHSGCTQHNGTTHNTPHTHTTHTHTGCTHRNGCVRRRSSSYNTRTMAHRSVILTRLRFRYSPCSIPIDLYVALSLLVLVVVVMLSLSVVFVLLCFCVQLTEPSRILAQFTQKYHFDLIYNSRFSGKGHSQTLHYSPVFHSRSTFSTSVTNSLFKAKFSFRRNFLSNYQKTPEIAPFKNALFRVSLII